ncbi:hypothetical protein [Leptospira sarikeiensis]|uniref:DUF1554 domain-containing protein n=1 Tax=Leptospira sarikeiensis TaxID=2484943 RepID=A0A4R9K5A6_9LEPT|nr:hypothetical protein [Leptospira sarikeiensis]TGL61398.1 hypothetical protein EHQ64_10445 [Leptospira sarikeiensis]
MRIYIYILLVSFLSFGCITDKTCSDEDKSCNPQAFLTSSLLIPQGIYVYSTATKYAGNLSAYGSTPEFSGQNICRGEKLFSSLVNQLCPDVWALIASESVPINTFSTSFSVPTSIPVFGPTGIELASTWDNFILGELFLERPLSDANLGTDDFWTFSGQGGGYAGSNCSGGTDKTSEGSGAFGSATVKDPDWLRPGGEAIASCNTTHRVLCICFTPEVSSGEEQQ